MRLIFCIDILFARVNINVVQMMPVTQAFAPLAVKRDK